LANNAPRIFMSVLNCSTGPSEIPLVPSSGTAGGSSVADTAACDQDLVQQTRVEIRRLVREITCLCQSNVALDDFYEQFLQRVVAALAAVGGAVWLLDSQGRPRLRSEIRLAETGITVCEAAAARHARLLRQCADERAQCAVPPESGSTADDAPGNPTGWLLLLGTLVVDDDVRAVVEVFQRPDGGPVTQRGYLRFLSQMCDLANDFLQNRRLRVLQQEQQRGRDLEGFLRTIHGRLDLQATAYAIANEGRRLTGADRLSVLVRHQGRCRVLAISGVDTIEQRADQVQRLARLAMVVLHTGEPLWYPAGDQELAPEIEQAVQQHIDLSHARMVGVVPLLAEDAVNQPLGEQPTAPLGALVLEQFHAGPASPELRRHAGQVARHAELALGNALAHHRVATLLPHRVLSGLRTVLGYGRWSHRTAAALGLAALIVVLTCLPATLRIPARGSVRPGHWHNIFARLDGTVDQVLVQHGQFVQQGQVLARLRNTELELEIAALAGQKQTLAEQILAVQQSLLRHERITPEERSRMTAELQQLRQRVDGIERQLELQRVRQESLLVRSPIAGQIVTWDVDEALATRPVRRGEALMTVVDPAGDWELELLIDEHDAGHVVAAAQQGGSDRDVEQASDINNQLPVTFALASYPGQEFTGRIVELDRTARRAHHAQAVVAARVRIDRAELPDVRCGTAVRARIDCGMRAAGSVWFRDVIELVHREVLFWL
jgi:multidrug efflux pump subunit AcrA (membrane-fusion protein)